MVGLSKRASKNKDAVKISSNKSKKDITKTQKTPSDSFPSDLLLSYSKNTLSSAHHHQPKPHSGNFIISLHPGAVYVAHNFFSTKECRNWINYVESNNCGGFEYASQKATPDYAHRECGRFQRNDWEMSRLLFERMKPLVIQLHECVKHNLSSKYSEPKTCNGNIRLYKYERGMSFGKHYDSSDSTPLGDTAVTVLIYLSSCKGGATRFYPPKGIDGSKTGIGFVPEEGAILMHMHGPLCLEHEADPVIEGIKYVLRTDIVYTHK